MKFHQPQEFFILYCDMTLLQESVWLIPKSLYLHGTLRKPIALEREAYKKSWYGRQVFRIPLKEEVTWSLILKASLNLHYPHVQVLTKNVCEIIYTAETKIDYFVLHNQEACCHTSLLREQA